MTARELFEQLEKNGLADLLLVTNPYDPEAEEDYWIEVDVIVGWSQTKWNTIYLETEH